jgi:hypothetical protein
VRRLFLASALLLAACDGGATFGGVPVSCASLGTDEGGAFTARLLDEQTGERAFVATCTRATRSVDRIVIRALVVSGALVEGEIVLTALGTAGGGYGVSAGTASARYILRGRVYEAVEGSVTLGTVGDASVTGAFDFATVGGPDVAGGEFTLPLR